MANQQVQVDIGLIKEAQEQAGPRRDELAKAVEIRIYAYIYRMTYNEHLAEDLTIVTMLESLHKLTFKAPGAFWAWVYRVALSKIQRHFSPHGNTRPGKTNPRRPPPTLD